MRVTRDPTSDGLRIFGLRPEQPRNNRSKKDSKERPPRGVASFCFGARIKTPSQLLGEPSFCQPFLEGCAKPAARGLGQALFQGAMYPKIKVPSNSRPQKKGTLQKTDTPPQKKKRVPSKTTTPPKNGVPNQKQRSQKRGTLPEKPTRPPKRRVRSAQKIGPQILRGHLGDHGAGAREGHR